MSPAQQIVWVLSKGKSKQPIDMSHFIDQQESNISESPEKMEKILAVGPVDSAFPTGQAFT
jgi:hypothetical protein